MLRTGTCARTEQTTPSFVRMRNRVSTRLRLGMLRNRTRVVAVNLHEPTALFGQFVFQHSAERAPSVVVEDPHFGGVRICRSSATLTCFACQGLPHRRCRRRWLSASTRDGGSSFSGRRRAVPCVRCAVSAFANYCFPFRTSRDVSSRGLFFLRRQ